MYEKIVYLLIKIFDNIFNNELCHTLTLLLLISEKFYKIIFTTFLLHLK